MQKYVIALYIRLSLEDYKYDSIQDHYISMENINANDSLWIIELGSP